MAADPLDFFEPDRFDPRLAGTFHRPIGEGGGGAIGSFVRGGVRSALPTAGGVAAFPAGAAAGGAIGAIGGPIGAGIGAGIGGFAAAMGAGAAVERLQDWAFRLAPGVSAALGQDETTREADELYHPLASFVGGVAPQALFMRPGLNGFGAAAAGAVIGGGAEAGIEYAHDGTVDPMRVAVQAGAGALFGHNRPLGDLIQTPAKALAARISRGPGATPAQIGAAGTLADMPVGMAEQHQTPDETAARTVAEHARHVAATNPFVPDTAGATAHGERLSNATEAVLAERAPDFGRLAGPVDFAATKRAIAGSESRGSYSARNPLPGQSAYGKYQFIDDTWLRVGRQVMVGASDAAIMAKRGDPATQERFMDHALATYAGNLRAGGAPVTPGNLYLAHFLGPAKALEVLHAAPDTPMARLVSSRVIKANRGYLEGRTARDLVAEMDRRTGGRGEPSTASPTRVTSEPVSIDMEAPLPRVDTADALTGDGPGLTGAGGRSVFGPVHSDLAGDWSAAVARLTADRTGEVPGAIHHPEIGPIDVVWGEAPSGRRGGFGLAKIAVKHPEMMADLPAIVEGLPIVQRPEETGNQRYVLADDTHRAVIAPDFEGVEKHWVVTAYERKAPGGQTTRRGPPEAPDGGSTGAGAIRGIADRAAQDNGPAEAGMAMLERQDEMGAPLPPAPPENGRGGGIGRDGSPTPSTMPDIVDPAALAKFDQPDGEGSKMQTESLEHDLRALAESGDTTKFRLTEDGPEQTIAEVLADLDAEAKSIDVLKACVAPQGTA